MRTPPPGRTVRKRLPESKVAATPRVRVSDTLLEALRLSDEAEAVAMLLDAFVAETGPQVVHAAARALGRTAHQLGKKLCILVDRDDDQRFRRSEARRK